MIYFYLSSCKDFKNYYLYYARYKYKGYFCLPSYSRIIQLWPRMLLPLTSCIMHCLGDEIGILYGTIAAIRVIIDSIKLAIYHNKYISSNRVCNKISKICKSSYCLFLCFKLHLVINNRLLSKLENDVE
ncbi:transposase DDE domain protein [Orientia tsutsugamushi str. UT76]|uniref:Transposase n=1 Tax=Orientia tsutsugamushi TaxID=784 RepID=A0A2U3RA07_ORITS|nr:transposase [Orientia tsutsugamushi]KJV90938.1 transposase DDE domain protein [Orientia tsutsugamushi str. UT76]SPR10084.1 transposase [Orientia tsutsugamushi]